jgi:hypothetical protein
MITSPLPGAKLWRGIPTLPGRCPLLMASPIKRRSVAELGLIRGAFDSTDLVTLGLLVGG